MNKLFDDLEWLCDWYRQQSNGDWEHEFGVTIATLDNPGWSLRVDLTGTSLGDLPFASEAVEDGENWYRLWKDDAELVFHGAASPAMLPTVLGRFRRWATAGVE